METTVRFVYEMKDVTKTIYQTRALLRSINNIRLITRDIQEVMKAPNLANVFWLLVNLSRMYNTLRRLLRLLRSATKEAALLGGIIEIPERIIGDGPTIPQLPMMGFAPMEMRVEAFRENIPMGLDGIDLSMIPEQSMEAVQRVLEEDAPITVEDAKRILVSRIIYPELSTGWLESSISWMPEAFGTRIYAGAHYAWWVEQGHQTFLGHHYLKDATDMARMRLPEKIRNELSKILKNP